MRSTSWLRDLIIETVWPYLSPGRASRGEQAAAPSGGSAASPSGGGRVTEQVRFSTLSFGNNYYVGRLDTAAGLADAQLLYRARGGEVIRSFTLEQRAIDAWHWDVRIVRSTSDRGTPAEFSPSIGLQINGSLPVKSLSCGAILQPGDCIFALVLTSDLADPTPGPRVDGILEIERNALVA